MPDTQFMTRAAAVTKGTRQKTALALSKLRLCKAPFVPTEFSTIDDFEANECDYDGYVAGGITLTAWTGPIYATGGGAVITSPIANPAYGPAGTPAVTNEVSAWWIENAAGDVELCGTFSPARPMAQVGDGFAFIAQDVEGKNAPAPAV